MKKRIVTWMNAKASKVAIPMRKLAAVPAKPTRSQPLGLRSFFAA